MTMPALVPVALALFLVAPAPTEPPAPSWRIETGG